MLTPLEIKQVMDEEECERIEKLFVKQKHGPGFKDKKDLLAWWKDRITLQRGRCFYCETTILDIRKLIDAGYLKTRKLRGDEPRGPKFEIERRDSKTNTYSKENCALICYYCNNDKSNIYSEEDYKKFLAPAKRAHFQFLLQQLEKKEAA